MKEKKIGSWHQLKGEHTQITETVLHNIPIPSQERESGIEWYEAKYLHQAVPTTKATDINKSASNLMERYKMQLLLIKIEMEGVRPDIWGVVESTTVAGAVRMYYGNPSHGYERWLPSVFGE